MMKIIIFIFKWDPDNHIPRLSDKIIILNLIFNLKIIMKIVILILKLIMRIIILILKLIMRIIILILKLMMRIIILMFQAARLCKTGSGGGLGISLEGTVDVEEGVEVGGHFL